MTSEQIIAVIAALVAGEPDPDFDPLRQGGYDDRYAVTVENCELPPGTLEVEGRTIICGSVSVPENHAKPEGRRIPLEFAILKARSLSPAPDPLIYLHGGPGGGALQALGPFSEIFFNNHRAHRDIIAFDQRSASLSSRSATCYENMADHIVELVGVTQKKLPDSTMAAFIAPCVQEIEASDADLSTYNTESNALDVRALMSALGYPTYNVYGGSYGTRLGLEVLRTAPEGVRSVILDGVAPPTVFLYDDLLGPYIDSLDALIDQCRSDEACNAAYPNLSETINAAFDKVIAEPIAAARGKPAIDARSLFGLVFTTRNSHAGKIVTPWLPRIFSELAVGDPATFDAVSAAARPDPTTTLKAAAGLSEDERTLVLVALETAEAMSSLDASARTAIDRLKRDLEADRAVTSVAEAFEARSTVAALSMSEDARAALLADYALLHTQEPGAEPLSAWINAHFSGDDQTALLDLIAAMSDDDIWRTFDIARSGVQKYEAVMTAKISQAIYACQEDFPYNSEEGFQNRIDELSERWGFAELFRGETEIFTTCEAFEKHPREGFQTPVVSDVPVIALNGLLDVQTSWRWGAVAVETLSNGRNFVFPEAGHGTTAYQRCANDISVAFLNNPTAEIDDTCIADITVTFAMPDDPLPK